MEVICEHVSKDFIVNNKNLRVLEDITAQAQDHDFVCVLGPNGCGKTTLLKIMAGVLSPSGGSVHYTGNNEHFLPASLIFQEQGLFPWLNVIDNICFTLEMKGLPRKERYKKAERYIEKMALAKFVDFYPHQISTGMKQKVNLTRGLLADSAVLLIDEPDTSLDICTKTAVQGDIYKIWDEFKKTIIYTTHDIEIALHFAKHIWVMGKSPGKIVEKIDVALYKSTRNGEEDEGRHLLNLEKKILAIIHREAQKL